MRPLGRRRTRRDLWEQKVAGNRLTLLHDGVEALPAMLEAIEAAREEILLEMYWFGSDRTGRRFAEALAERARAGVRVKIIYDAVGSIDASGELFEGLKAAGCQVYQYNPIAPWRRRFRIGLVNHRDHRKVLVVDGRVAFTGGVNLGDPWAPQAEGGEGWRDDMIRIEGPGARGLRDVFVRTWQELGLPAFPDPGRFPSTPAGVSESRGAVRVLANHYRAERKAIRIGYLRAIRSAREHIYIANSYFVPDRAVRRGLCQAAARGVEVVVLVPGESDVPAVYHAGRSLYDGLLQAGIKLYEWQGTVLHAKTAVVDDHWCTLGSFNFDYRSIRFNLEVNVTVEDAQVARDMSARFRQDLERSVPIDLRHWRYRSISERLLEQVCYLLRGLL